MTKKELYSIEKLMEEKIVKLTKRGGELLNAPLLNKGTHFSEKERDELGITGLLPPKISTLEQQIRRSYLNFSQKKTPLEKYDSLIGLMSRNELLFYQFSLRYPTEIVPIIYTPTVGEAAMQYSKIYFHQRGLYIAYQHKNRIDEIFENYAHDEVEVIVVTDGERILGLGDLGIGGMVIPIGKLTLYTLFAGIHPAKTLPIILDVGTNNESLLNDELYLGSNHKRVTGSEYDDFIEKFVEAVRKRYPKVLLQWEDFGKNNARRLLEKYREKILSFNDDIQGTAAAALSALLSALQVSKQKLSDQKIVIFGAGSAGTGIADTIAAALVADGLSLEQACQKIYMIDIDGLIRFSSKNISSAQRPYMQPQSNLSQWEISSEHISLMDVIKNVHPTILIGVSAQGGAFTKEIIVEMAQHTERPIIFPLSNPTSKAECTPEDAIRWTKGKVILATGSPFPPVDYEGKTYTITQCNNVYIFPGVGLGAVGIGADQVTDQMFIEAARTLALFSPALKNDTASLLPPLDQIRSISEKIAIAVAKKAIEEKVAKGPLSEVEERIRSHIWAPHYPKHTSS